MILLSLRWRQKSRKKKERRPSWFTFNIRTYLPRAKAKVGSHFNRKRPISSWVAVEEDASDVTLEIASVERRDTVCARRPFEIQSGGRRTLPQPLLDSRVPSITVSLALCCKCYSHLLIFPESVRSFSFFFSLLPPPLRWKPSLQLLFSIIKGQSLSHTAAISTLRANNCKQFRSRVKCWERGVFHIGNIMAEFWAIARNWQIEPVAAAGQ